VLTLRMAWRNAWRNRRRTSIVVTAVAVGIAGTLLSMAVNYGMVIQMVDTAIVTELGHLQVHARGFDANPELRVRLRDGGRESVGALEGLEGVRSFSRRVRGEGLISSPRASAGVRVVGIEPAREARVSVIADSITEGRYLDGVGRRVLIGERLASRLEVGVGDKVVVSVQDLAGDLSGEALRVEGLFRTPSRELDRGSIFVRLDEGQRLLGLGDAVSEIVVIATSRSEIGAVRDALVTRLEAAEVRTWEELQPVLVYMIEIFDDLALVMYAAIFIAMAFGIANVLLMTVFERTREIGIMTAIGFGRRRLVAAIVLEALVVTLLGVALGFAAAVGGVWALQDGIDLRRFAEGLTAYGIGTRIVPVLRQADFSAPIGVAIVTAVLASAWPAWRAVRLRPAEAVRQT
jgi:ABC-type lipoprotein release transport system permease subunit